MTNYTSLRSILRMIPTPLFQHSTEYDFLSWALDGLRESKIISMYEPKVKIFEVVDKKIQLPDDIKEINLVTYLAKKPTDSEVNSFTSCLCEPESMSNPSDTNNICNYTIAYKMFIDSEYYNNNFQILQYKGNGSYICENCPNKNTPCQITFTVDKNKTLHTNLESGFICVDYDTEVVDVNGDLMIPDWQELKQFLVYYALYKHWEERTMMSEQNAYQLSKDYLIKSEIYLNKIKGTDKLRKINANSVGLLQGGVYQKLIKVPNSYVFAR